MTRAPYPVEVRRDGTARTVHITWSDGHVSAYPFAYLRGWCPCAGCQGHGGERRFVHGPSDLERIGLVGRYALNPITAYLLLPSQSLALFLVHLLAQT